MSHHGDTFPVSPPTFPAKYMTRYANAIRNMPMAIFVVVDGSMPFSSSFFQSHTSGREKAITKKGSIAFEMMPENCQSVLSLAKYVRVEPFWKKSIQKTTEIR